MTNQSDQPTISLAAAAEKLGTNSLVIQRWIKEGHIQAATGLKGEPRVLQVAFEELCQEITAWLKNLGDADEEGYTRASVAEMEEFWKSS